MPTIAKTWLAICKGFRSRPKKDAFPALRATIPARSVAGTPVIPFAWSWVSKSCNPGISLNKPRTLPIANKSWPIGSSPVPVRADKSGFWICKRLKNHCVNLCVVSIWQYFWIFKFSCYIEKSMLPWNMWDLNLH